MIRYGAYFNPMTHVYPISGIWGMPGAAEIALQLEAMEAGRMGRAGLDSFRKKQGRELESLIRPRSTYHRRPTSRFAPPEVFCRAVAEMLITQRELLPPVPPPAPFRRGGSRNSEGRDRDAIRGTLEIQPIASPPRVKRDTRRGMSPYDRVQGFFQTEINLATQEVRNYMELGYVGVGKEVGQPLTEVEFAQLAVERLNSLMTILKRELWDAAAQLDEPWAIPPSPYEWLYLNPDGPFHRHPLLYDAALFLFHLFQEAMEADMDLIELAGSDPDMGPHFAILARENLELLGKIIDGTP